MQREAEAACSGDTQSLYASRGTGRPLEEIKRECQHAGEKAHRERKKKKKKDEGRKMMSSGEVTLTESQPGSCGMEK